jgi:hypothetical protein
MLATTALLWGLGLLLLLGGPPEVARPKEVPQAAPPSRPALSPSAPPERSRVQADALPPSPSGEGSPGPLAPGLPQGRTRLSRALQGQPTLRIVQAGAVPADSEPAAEPRTLPSPQRDPEGTAAERATAETQTADPGQSTPRPTEGPPAPAAPLSPRGAAMALPPPASAPQVLTLIVGPSGTSVRVDGDTPRPLPLSIRLPVGPHHFELQSADGVQLASQTHEVVRGPLDDKPLLLPLGLEPSLPSEGQP